jgi:hypothetical protein
LITRDVLALIGELLHRRLHEGGKTLPRSAL